jgi:toxin-antitoxin system PIN domain toxin
VTTYLLDANVLIALTVVEHVDHQRASVWAGGVDRFAVCPIVEGALVRFLVRTGERASAAREIVERIRDRPGYEFWPDSLSYAEAELAAVHGHRQVTDAYLVSLVAQYELARLATLDEGLARTRPDLTVLVPRR